MKHIIIPALLSLSLALAIFTLVGINATNDEKAAKEDAQASLAAVNIELESEKQRLNVTMKQYGTIKEELTKTKNELADNEKKLAKTQKDLTATKKDLASTKTTAAKKKQYLKDKVANLTEQLKKEKSLKK